MPTNGNEIVEANQSTWTKALEAIGYGKFLLIELPVPATPGGERATRAAELLKEAQRFMQEGRYRQAAGQCRNALEALGEDLGTVTEEVSRFLRDGQRGDSLTKEQRLAAVGRALWMLASPAHHQDPNARTVTFDRQDVAAMIMMTGGAIALFTEGEE